MISSNRKYHFKAVHSPGTPEHICYLVSDGAHGGAHGYCSGDFIFVGDVGSPDLLESAAGMEGMMENWQEYCTNP